MTQIQSLVGLSAETVKGFEEDVLNLAGETGRAPKELADAMFFITSAGLRGEDALEALAASAKAAASGLGQTEVVADAVTNALNGYETGAISASEATDVLVKTVEQGKASAADLAPQFGRLVPMAAELGVSFDQLGGGLAFLTRSSGDASQAAVGLKGILSKIVKPSQQGIKELEKMGLSMADLRKHVREKGLLSALDMLKKGSEENGFEMAKFFEDVEGLNGVLALTGPKAAEAREVFDELSKSTGKLDEAFAIASDTTEFKMNQAMSGMKTLLVELGSTILPLVVPMVQSLTGFISDLADKFRSLNPAQQKMILLVGGIVAAIGPALMIVGKLTSFLGFLVGGVGKAILVLGKLKVLFLALGGPLTLTIAAIAALTAGFVVAYKKSETFRNIVHGVLGWFQNVFWPGMQAVADAFVAAWTAVAAFAQEFLAPIVTAVFEGIMAVGEAFKEFFSALVEFFVNLVTGDWSELWDNFKTIVVTALNLIVELFVKLPARIIKAAFPLIKKMADFALEAGMSFIKAFGKFVVNTLLPFYARLPRRIFTAVVAVIGAIFDLGTRLGSEMFEGLKDFLGDVGKIAAKLMSGAISIGKRIVEWIVEGVKAIAGKIGEAVMSALPTPGDIAGALGGLLGDIGGGIGGFFKSAIPGLADGGIVTRPTLAVVGEAGPEAVIPLSKAAPAMGQQGTQIVVNVAGSVVSERDLVESVRQGLLQSQRSGRQLVL